MKKLFFTLLLLIVFITTACANEATHQEMNKEESTKQQESNGTANTEEGQDNNDESKLEVQLVGQAKDILEAIGTKNTGKWSNYVHPKKGVLFSPYSYIEGNSVVFSKDQIAGFFHDTNTYTWGVEDGSGEPIELTPNDYYSNYIYDGRYEKAKISFDRNEARGNLKRNINEMFPDSHTVEFYLEGTEENGNMDWKALNLVFEKDAKGEWKLVAIVHDQWTI